MKDPIIGNVRFTDGCERPICQASDGRQYVVDGAGLRVFGTWILTADGDGDLSIVVQAPGP